MRFLRSIGSPRSSGSVASPRGARSAWRSLDDVRERVLSSPPLPPDARAGAEAGDRPRCRVSDPGDGHAPSSLARVEHTDTLARARIHTGYGDRSAPPCADFFAFANAASLRGAQV